MSTTAESICEDFIRHEQTYIAFAVCLEQLLNTLLDRNGITVHTISHRVKSGESLFEKVNRPGKSYQRLADITDLAGLRIITYLPEDVDKVSLLVESEFAVDRINSIDKRLATDPDRFGYASLHKVCSFNDQRLSLAEYGAFRGLKCEIQIRTILQHAWAEIEHDLGYKAVVGVPTKFKRRFSRLAALLEAADDEFMRLKADLTAYSDEIQEKVRNCLPGIPIDKVTLRIFVETNEQLREIEIANPWQNQGQLDPISLADLDGYVQDFLQLGVAHIDSLANALDRHKNHIGAGAKRCEAVDYGPMYCHAPSERGWPLWMLIQLLCAERPTLADTIDAFKAIELWIPDSLEAYAESLRAIVRDGKEPPIPMLAKDYKSVYVTLADEEGSSNSFPLKWQGDKWVWENITVTDDHFTIDGQKYPIEKKSPLSATVVHKGKTFAISW